MIRWFIRRDGSKVLQHYEISFTHAKWVDVPEIDEVQELPDIEEGITNLLKNKAYKVP